MKHSLSVALVERGLVTTRSQADSYIKLGHVEVNDKVVKAPTTQTSEGDKIIITTADRYVSRAGLKLASVAEVLGLKFANKVVIDVGSSTGGFTDYALKHGAKKVIAIEIGKDQLHPSLRLDSRVELHEKTDVLDYVGRGGLADLVLVDISFNSLKNLLTAIAQLIDKNGQILVLFKPQFEASPTDMTGGLIKNDKVRRRLIKDFEVWLNLNNFLILNKVDSRIKGSSGNEERFYLLAKAANRANVLRR